MDLGKYQYPWLGILANIQSNQSATSLKEILSAQGFNPTKVILLWEKNRGFSGFAIVEFQSNWTGFADALNFDKAFAAQQRGRSNFFIHPGALGMLYGWIADEDDHYSQTIYGKRLRILGDLKTTFDVQAEEQTRHSKVLLDMERSLHTTTHTLDALRQRFFRESSVDAIFLQGQKDEEIEVMEKIKGMEAEATGKLNKIMSDHQMMTMELERKKQNLEEQASRCTAQEKEILQSKRGMIEKAIEEQKKATERVLKLAQVQKEEREKLHIKLARMDKQIEERNMLELHIEDLRQMLEIEQTQPIQRELDRAKKKLNYLYPRNKYDTSSEIDEGKKEFIEIFSDASFHEGVGVKRINTSSAPVLWDFVQNRELCVKEGLNSLMQHWKKEHNQ